MTKILKMRRSTDGRPQSRNGFCLRAFKAVGCLLIGALTCLAPAFAGKFEVSPISGEIEQVGGQLNFVVSNQGDKASPFEIWFERIERGSDHEEGELTVRNDEAFIVFPPSMIIEPNKSQSVRIQWLGGDEGSDEEAAQYFMIVHQPAVQLNGAGLAVAINFRVRVAVGDQSESD